MVEHREDDLHARAARIAHYFDDLSQEYRRVHLTLTQYQVDVLDARAATRNTTRDIETLRIMLGDDEPIPDCPPHARR